MRKIIYLLMLCLIGFSACNSEPEAINASSDLLKSTKITMHLNSKNNKSLILSDNNGLKSSAIEYSCTVAIGDTIYWQLEEESDITSIEDIVIITSDCGAKNLFKDGIVFNENKTQCYGVVSAKAFGSAKYDIKFMYNGDVITDDPEIIVHPPLD